MATHPQNTLQTDIFDTLTADGTLTTLLGGVSRIYDDVPDNPDFPYVEIGDDDFSDLSSHTGDGFDADLTIRVWSRDRGRKTCKDIQNRIYELLHDTDPALATFPTITFRCTTTNIIKDPDARTHQGVQVFKLMLGGN